MSKLKIKLHENNDALVDRYADGTKQDLVPRIIKTHEGFFGDGVTTQYLIPRIIKALDAMKASGELDGNGRDARTCRHIVNKLKRNPEIKDALDWWLDALVSVYLKEDV